jgi:hypothetical protein
MATDGHARGRDGTAGLQGSHAANVISRRALGRTAAQHDFGDLIGLDARAFNGVLDRVPRHSGTTGVVESAPMGLGQSGSGGGYDDSFAH